MPPDADPPTLAMPDAPDKTDGSSVAGPPGAEPPRGGGSKVALDLDDAPFLEEPEEKKPPVEAAEPETAPSSKGKGDETAPAKGLKLKTLLAANKKKLAILGGGLALLLVVLPLGLMFLMGGEKTPPPPPPAPPERVVVSGVPPREDAPPGPTFLYRLNAFLIERRGSEGELRFLHCGFAIPTEHATLFAELGAKNIAVRDAIYYYLRNKPLTFLADEASREMLRQDLLSVINEQVSSEKVTELLFEEYFVTGK